MFDIVMSPNVCYGTLHWTRGMHWPKSLGKVMKNYQGGEVGQIYVWFDGQIVK